MNKLGNFIDYGSFALLDVCWHYWESEWHVQILHLEWSEQDRSLISVGRRAGEWFVDLLWIRVWPADDA